MVSLNCFSFSEIAKTYFLLAQTVQEWDAVGVLKDGCVTDQIPVSFCSKINLHISSKDVVQQTLKDLNLVL